MPCYYRYRIESEYIWSFVEERPWLQHPISVSYGFVKLHFQICHFFLVEEMELPVELSEQFFAGQVVTFSYALASSVA